MSGRLAMVALSGAWVVGGPVVSASPPANDAFADAEAIGVGGHAGTTLGATAEVGEPRTHQQRSMQASVWYSFSPGATGLHTVSVTGSDTTPIGHVVAVYSGDAIDSLARVSWGPAFEALQGVTYRLQVTAEDAWALGGFRIVIAPDRAGTIVLPFFSTWDFVHPLDGGDPTKVQGWAQNWRKPDWLLDLGRSGSHAFGRAAGPFGFSDLEGPPGIFADIGYPPGLGTANNSAYFRASFTLARDTSNLWAEVLADDGAYIYIDDFPGVPLRIAARLGEESTLGSMSFADHRPQPDVHVTGKVPLQPVAGGPAGCRAYQETAFRVERETQMVFLGGLLGKIGAGEHSIAVSVHETSEGSADMAFDLQLLDYAPRKLEKNRTLEIAFSDTVFVDAVGASGQVPAAEHHHAPRQGQQELAWYCVSPTTRAGRALPNGAAVVTDGTIGAIQGKALRFRGAEAQRFTTEPIAVGGLSQFSVAVKIRTDDAGDGFEPDDGYRIFLETSADGIDFSEPERPLELQAQIDGVEALSYANQGWTAQKLVVVPSASDQAVRLVMTGGTDDATESVYLDDVRFVGGSGPPDADNDGLDDDWEVQNFGARSERPDGDRDGDGSCNLDEYVAGTRPNDASSRWVVSAAARDDESVRLTWASLPGRNYRIQRTDESFSGWSDAGPVMVGDPAPATTMTRSVPHDGRAASLFRVVVWIPE